MDATPIKVLLIEDDPNMASTFRRTLRRKMRGAFEVEWADRLNVGLNYLKENKANIILLDLCLPDSQGIGTLAKVLETTQDTPVIALTGLDDDELAAEAMQKGAQDYLVKGQMDPNMLGRSINYALERHGLIKKLRQNMAALQTSQARISSLVASMPAGVLMMNARLEIIFANPLAKSLLKVQEKSSKASIKSETGIDLDAIVKSFLATKKQVWQTEIETIPPHNQIISFVCAKISDKRGWHGDIVIIMQDITKEKELERLKSEFITNLSHELRTPMTSIKNAINMVLDGTTGEINANQDKFLSMAMRNIDRLARLINDILDFSKLESQSRQLKFEPVEYPELIENVIRAIQPHADEKHIALNKAVKPVSGVIKVDSDKIEQVLINLLSNAIKFTGDSGQISVVTELCDANYSISNTDTVIGEPNGMVKKRFLKTCVKDSGVGIDAAALKTVFDRFIQVKAGLTAKTKGTGLGLSICKKIVELHHGEIGVESEKNVGSTFWFTLPFEEK